MPLLLAQLADAGGIASASRSFPLKGHSTSFDSVGVEQPRMLLPPPSSPPAGSTTIGVAPAVPCAGAPSRQPALAGGLEAASQHADSRHEQLGLRISTRPVALPGHGGQQASEHPAVASAERDTPRRRQPIVWQPQPQPTTGEPGCAPPSADELQRLSARFLRFHCQPGAAAPNGHAMAPPLHRNPYPNHSIEAAAPGHMPSEHGARAAAVATPAAFDPSAPDLPPGYDGSLSSAAAAADAGRSVIALPGAVGLRIKARLPPELATIQEQQQPQQLAHRPSASLPTSPLAPAHAVPSLWAANGLLPVTMPATTAAGPATMPTSPMSPAVQQLLFHPAHAAAAQQEAALQALLSSVPAAHASAHAHAGLPAATGWGAAPPAAHLTAFGQAGLAAGPQLHNINIPSAAAAGQNRQPLYTPSRARQFAATPDVNQAAAWSPPRVRKAAAVWDSSAGPRGRHYAPHEWRTGRNRSRSASPGWDRKASPLRRTHRSSPERLPHPAQAGARSEWPRGGSPSRGQRQGAGWAGEDEGREDGGREPSRGRSKRRRLRSKSRRRILGPHSAC